MWPRRTLLFAIAACSGNPEKSTPAPQPAPADAAVAIDRGTESGSNDPTRHPDPDPDPAKRPPAKPPKSRAARPIDVILKSTPNNARVFVDNVEIGRTPNYWYGDADGQAHEFVFTLDGYNVAHYKFVPVQSGTVHARLEPADKPDDPKLKFTPKAHAKDARVDSKSEPKASEPKPSEPKSGEPKSGEPKPGDPKPDPRPGELSGPPPGLRPPGTPKPDPNPGEPKPGSNSRSGSNSRPGELGGTPFGPLP